MYFGRSQDSSRHARRRGSIGLAAAVVALLPAHAVAASAQTPHGPGRAQLQRAMALWSSRHVHNYTFRIRFGGFPVPGGYRPVRITVRGSTVSHGSGGPVLYGGGSGSLGGGISLDTVPKLFREIRHVLDDPQAGAVIVRYDRVRGFPVSASIDPIKSAVDDEFGWTIDQFRG